MIRIGWAGLGKMGSVMAPRLTGFGPVTGFDPSPAGAGAMPLAADLPALAAGSDVLFTMLPDDAAFAGVAAVAAAHMPEGACLIDMSTLSPGASAAGAATLGAAGIGYLRAPVSGSTGLAAEGTLTILASGPRPLFEAHEAMLAALGRKITWFGAAEEARVAKLVVNTVIGAINHALAEALDLGRRGGLDWAQMIDFIADSAVASPYVASKVDKLKRRDWTPAATVALIAKDLDLVLDLAKSVGAYMPAAATHRQVIAAMEGRGLSGRDMSSVLSFFEGDGT